MVDVSATIAPKSDQLNADDLIGKTLTIKVTKVSRGEAEQPININFEGDNNKPYKPCKSMRRVLVQVWGKDGQQYVGRSMTLYRDDDVMFGGVAVGGIRISHMSHMKDDKQVTLALTASKAKKKPFVVKPLVTGAQQSPPAQEYPPITPETKAAGEAAAKKGEAAYVEWLGSLTPEVKATVRPYHQEWAKTAKAVVVAPPPVDEIPFGDDGDDEPAM